MTLNQSGKRVLRIGTRSSPLALWQAEHVRDLIMQIHSDIEVTLVHISTAGDRDRNSPLAAVGGMGLFTKEIQRALLDESVDIAVHSLKDLPTAQPDGLVLGAIPAREEVADALISPKFKSIDKLPEGARVGTSSLRRKAQLLHDRPDLVIEPVRGNVETRMNRALSGDMDAVILATAGLNRLGFAGNITEVLGPPAFLPAVGQGALGVECRRNDAWANEVLLPLNHGITRASVLAERHLLRLLEGGCMIPLSAWGRVDETGRMRLTGRVFSLDGQRMAEAEAEGEVDAPGELGKKVAEQLLARDAAAILSTSPTGG
jgi:hydroxymethylbilane synthase